MKPYQTKETLDLVTTVPVTNETEYDNAITIITKLQTLIYQQELKIHDYLKKGNYSAR